MLEVLTAAALAAIGCTDLPGADELVRRPEIGFVLVGEYHGTNEMPAVARDIACAATAAGRPLVFGVELTPVDQPAIDAFMQSDGRPAARAALLASPGWAERGGRTTVAIVEMLEAVRRLGARHKVAVVAFDAAPTARGTSAVREAVMAKMLKKAAARLPGSVVVALTGVGHAGKTAWTSFGPPFASLGGLLPKDRTVALAFARLGGQYWGCHAPNGDPSRGCTAYDMPPREPVAERGIRMDATLREGFDGVYSPGVRYTASRPAVRAPRKCEAAVR
jgi:hypothetical protein